MMMLFLWPNECMSKKMATREYVGFEKACQMAKDLSAAAIAMIFSLFLPS